MASLVHTDINATLTRLSAFGNCPRALRSPA